jgi:hypothetical protein
MSSEGMAPHGQEGAYEQNPGGPSSAANSHFSEIYFRVTANRVSGTEVHNALYELLKRDEISTTGGKWRLIEERRKAF